MDLRAIVTAAMNAVPTGLKGPVVFSRTTGRVFTRATDGHSAGVTETSTALNVVVTTPTDDVAIDGMEIERQRRVTVAASEVSFALDVNDTATFGGHDWTIFKMLPTGPDGVTPALYDMVVSR